MGRRRVATAAGVACLLGWTCATPSAPPERVPADLGAPSITAGRIGRHIATLADDAFEGRGPGTRGDEKTRAYLRRELEAMGLEPGALDGSFEQPVPLVAVTSHAPEHWTFVGAAGSETFAREKPSASGVGLVAITKAPLSRAVSSSGSCSHPAPITMSRFFTAPVLL